MQLGYHTLDVFTSTRFGGNPLAVVLDADALSAEQMQAVAREFNYSETTFVCASENADNDARVRIFTPTFEMPFAGHPNVGTGFLLASLNAAAERFVFEEIAGLVPITIERDGETIVGVEIASPGTLQVGPSASVEAVAACIGLEPADILVGTHEPCTASVGAAFTIVELASRDALSRMEVDDPSRLANLGGLDAVYAYTRDARSNDTDICARMIFDANGLVEDPATGSATAACAALIHSRTGESGLSFAQGIDMGRPSLIRSRVEEGTAYISGTCVPVMTGELTI